MKNITVNIINFPWIMYLCYLIIMQNYISFARRGEKEGML